MQGMTALACLQEVLTMHMPDASGKVTLLKKIQFQERERRPW